VNLPRGNGRVAGLDHLVRFCLKTKDDRAGRHSMRKRERLAKGLGVERTRFSFFCDDLRINKLLLFNSKTYSSEK